MAWLCHDGRTARHSGTVEPSAPGWWVMKVRLPAGSSDQPCSAALPAPQGHTINSGATAVGGSETAPRKRSSYRTRLLAARITDPRPGRAAEGEALAIASIVSIGISATTPRLARLTLKSDATRRACLVHVRSNTLSKMRWVPGASLALNGASI
jgi:hypothetical protein